MDDFAACIQEARRRARACGVAPHDSDDVMQETLVRVWQRLRREGHTRGGSLRALVGTVLKGLVVDRRRRSRDVASFDEVETSFGRIDLLFNNAGTGSYPVPFEEIPFEDWRRVLDVNLTGSFLCAQRAVALMKRQDPPGGRIINNGSISAHVPRPNSAPYTATKHAITGLTKSISLDGRAHGISCGQIDIGNAATPMTARMADGVPQADGSIKPEPTMDVADVGRAVAYMASLPPDANVLTMTVMANDMPFVGRG